MPTPPTRSELLRGTRLGNYEVGALIGHGGMGSVFEGSHVALGKAVALKVLHEHIAQSEAMRARFVREAQLAATLSHPHVVNIHDVGVDGENAYLVMERLNGEDLAAHLRRVKKEAIEAALAVFMPVASALAFAHERGIVHRDLKPANIFLARDRHGEILPKIVDFGLSKLLTAEDAPALTESDAVIGTLEYMAPEQTYGTARAGPLSDQYSLAAILYEMVTGHLPFHRSDTRELLEAIRYAPVVVPSALEPLLPSGFDDAVVRALSREPDERFPDVKAFARALLRFADAPTASVWERDFGEPAAEDDATLRTSMDDLLVSDTIVGVPPPAPKLPCDPGSSTFHIKGIAYRSVVLLVERKLPGGLDTLDEELADAATSTFVRQPFLAASRYDILPMLPVNVAIARVLGKSLDVIAEAQGVAQARYDVRHVYRRPFEEMTFDTLPAFLVRFAIQYYEAGELTAEAAAPGHIVVHRRRLPAYVLPWLSAIQVAYAEELVRLKGGRSVTATPRAPVEAATRKGVAVVDLDVDLRWTAGPDSAAVKSQRAP
jgi:serine/threonine protein kinase